MCGIVGGIVRGELTEQTKYSIQSLLKLSGHRGRDGYGWSLYRNGQLTTKKFMGLAQTSDQINEFVSSLKDGDRFIFNTRAAPVTEGGVVLENVHPHNYQARNSVIEWSVVHNGIISNDIELKKQYGFDLKSNVDSEVVAAMLSKFEPSRIAEKLLGGFAILYLNSKGRFGVIRNYKTLHHFTIPGQFYGFASEQNMIKESFPNGDLIIDEFPKESFMEIDKFNYAIDGTFKASYMSYTPELDKEKALIVVSGGMDSSLCAYIAQKHFDMDVSLIHFNYGHKSHDMELDACHVIADDLDCHLEIVDLDWLGALGASPLTSDDIDVPLGRESSKTSLCWVPARNLVMLSLAAAYAEANGIKYIFYGSNLEEEGPAWKDNDHAAVESFNDALFYGTLNGVSIVNILGRMMKRDIITLAHHLEVPMNKTCSCDEPVYFSFDNSYQACGQCGCCHNRRHAYIQAGIDDPQAYTHDMIDHYPSSDAVGDTDVENIMARIPELINLKTQKSPIELYLLSGRKNE